MGRFQHQHGAVRPGGLEQRRAGLGGLAPQNGSQRPVAVRGGVGQRGAGEGFPPVPGVGKGRAPFHRQHGVQQQHALLGPERQVGAGRAGRTKLRFQFLTDVFQAGRGLAAVGHREGQPHGLAGFVVGVLPQDHDPRPFGGASPESGKNLFRRRVNGRAGGGFGHKFVQRRKIGFAAFTFQKRRPAAGRQRFQLFAQKHHR